MVVNMNTVGIRVQSSEYKYLFMIYMSSGKTCIMCLKDGGTFRGHQSDPQMTLCGHSDPLVI